MNLRARISKTEKTLRQQHAAQFAARLKAMSDDELEALAKQCYPGVGRLDLSALTDEQLEQVIKTGDVPSLPVEVENNFRDEFTNENQAN